MTILENGKIEKTTATLKKHFKQNLGQRGYNDAQISRAIELLKRETNLQKPLPTQ